ncbi:MAG: hypothetical protein IMZ64_07235 [Bacteroidetes bacterium]|nr:hypothetical protein [Bacteroidota bacterium]
MQRLRPYPDTLKVIRVSEACDGIQGLAEHKDVVSKDVVSGVLRALVDNSNGASGS